MTNQFDVFTSFSKLNNIGHVLDQIKIKAEVHRDIVLFRDKDEGPDIIADPDHLTKLFQKEPKLLSSIWKDYVRYGSAMVYKIRTLKAVTREAEEKPIYDYRQGAVAGLKHIRHDLWQLRESAANGKIEGALLLGGYIDSALNEPAYVENQRFIHITDWNPMNPNRGRSMVDVLLAEAGVTDQTAMASNIPLECVSGVFGVDRELLQVDIKGISLPPDRYAVLVKRAVEDTIIPIAQKFALDIQKQLGLPQGLRLRLDTAFLEHSEDPQQYWDMSQPVYGFRYA